MPPQRVLLADDHSLMRAGLRSLLEAIPGFEVVGEANDGIEALALMDKLRPHLVLMDIAMPTLNGLDTTKRAVHDHPQMRIIILSMHINEEYVRRALQAGAKGYLLKGADPAELRIAVETVTRGEVYLSPAVSKQVVSAHVHGETTDASSFERLTPRQRQVLQLLAEGHRTKEIAQKLKISARTVESHRAQMMEELAIHDLAGLVKYAIRMGLISP